MRQKKALAIGLAIVVVSSFAGWIAGRQIRSPAEEAARAEPPNPSPITVAAERKVLSSEVTARGTVRYGAPQLVSLPESLLKKGTPTITSAPTKGAMVTEGSAIFTVSGRPVLALAGERPAYRDMGPGSVGDDVRQLESALQRLGFSPGKLDGTYDAQTAKAVTSWYLSLGWTPLGPTEDQLQVLRATQADLFAVESELLNAHDALTQAYDALAKAQDKAVAARSAAGAAPAAAAAEAGRREADRLRAEADVARAEEAVEAALEAEEVAQLRLAEARTPPPGPSAAQVDAHRSAVSAASAGITVARAELDAAVAAQEAARRAGAATVAARQLVLDTEQAKVPQDPAAIAVAEAELAAAQAEAEASRLRTVADVAARRAALDAASAAHRNAQLVLTEALAPPRAPATASELAALAATVRQAASAVQAARLDLSVANANLAALSASVPSDGGAADAARAAAEADGEVVRAGEAVAVAQRRVALVSNRATDLAVNRLGGNLGTQVPADEVVFFPSLPVRIDDVKAKSGDQITGAGPVFTVTNSRLAVEAGLAVGDAKLVRKGAQVSIHDADLGTRVPGVVAEVAERPGTNGVDPGRFFLQVTPTDGAAGLLVGASVVLTITVESTESDVLTVPVAALSVGSDGTSRAQVRAPDGTTRFVEVIPGLTSKGLVAVTPAPGESLKEGDLVVIGSSGSVAARESAAGARP